MFHQVKPGHTGTFVNKYTNQQTPEPIEIWERPHTLE